MSDVLFDAAAIAALKAAAAASAAEVRAALAERRATSKTAKVGTR